MNAEMPMQPSEGPWRHTKNWLCPGELKGCIVKAGDIEIAHVMSRSVGSQAICDANARLMGAAPELLAALKATLAVARIKWGNLDGGVNQIFAMADAAISKAEDAIPSPADERRQP